MSESLARNCHFFVNSYQYFYSYSISSKTTQLYILRGLSTNIAHMWTPLREMHSHTICLVGIGSLTGQSLVDNFSLLFVRPVISCLDCCYQRDHRLYYHKTDFQKLCLFGYRQIFIDKKILK